VTIAAKNECTALVREADAKLDKIADNPDLTPEAKKRQRAELAREFITKLEAAKTFSRAREAAEYVLSKYQTKIDSNLTPATDAQSVGVHAQIRGQLLAMKDPKERMSFFNSLGVRARWVARVTAPIRSPHIHDHSSGLVSLGPQRRDERVFGVNDNSVGLPFHSQSDSELPRHFWPSSKLRYERALTGIERYLACELDLFVRGGCRVALSAHPPICTKIEWGGRWFKGHHMLHGPPLRASYYCH
jgi:hypothetical protein